MSGVDSVLSQRLDPHGSGVARFNHLLSQHLGVALVSLLGPGLVSARRPLLSFKPSELSESEVLRLGELLEQRTGPFELFLHEWSDLPIERELVGGAAHIACGSSEIHESVQVLNRASEPVWVPGLLPVCGALEPADLTVFTFGMAHKVKSGHFARLHELLERTGRSYALYVSSANHESADINEGEAAAEEVRAAFPSRVHFVGHLSDRAVSHMIRSTTYFAAFFAGGVRENNTTVAAAMEHAAVVLTNLDARSPPWLRHMETVIDVERCTELPLAASEREAIGATAVAATRGLAWEALVARLEGLYGRDPSPQPGTLPRS